MCSGKSKKKRAKEKAEKERKRQQAIAEQRQRELDALAAQRQAIAAQQAAQQQALQQQAAANAAAQQQRAARAKQQYASQMSALRSQSTQRINAINRQTEETRRQGEIAVRNLNITNQAVTSSLRILSEGTTNRAPQAQQSRRTERTTGAKNTSTGLRMGSQPSSSGANLAT